MKKVEKIKRRELHSMKSIERKDVGLLKILDEGP